MVVFSKYILDGTFLVFLTVLISIELDVIMLRHVYRVHFVYITNIILTTRNINKIRKIIELNQ